MKVLILTFCLLASEIVFAAGSGVYCINDGKVYNALSEETYLECIEALTQGEACFTGKRAEIIKLINNDAFNWDEELLESVHYAGPDAISYLYTDGPNDYQEKLTMSRCPKTTKD